MTMTITVHEVHHDLAKEKVDFLLNNKEFSKA
jgi:hypothetical protein